MKEWFEYKLRKRQLILSLIIYFLMIATIGLLVLSLYFSTREYDRGEGAIGYFPLFLGFVGLGSLLVVPYIIVIAYYLLCLKGDFEQCEYYVVEFKDMHSSYFFGAYFSLEIEKKNGETVHVDTKAMFYRFFSAYENFLNKKVKVALNGDNQVAVIGVVNDDIVGQ